MKLLRLGYAMFACCLALGSTRSNDLKLKIGRSETTLFQ